MQFIWSGVVGFLVAYLFDLVSLYHLSYAKQVVGFAAVGLIGYAHIMVCIRGERLLLSTSLSYIGWPLFFLAGLALIYSLFLEIPFKRTYITEGTGDKLVTTGTYALVRHPGVLWYALMLIGLTLISRRWLALFAAPIWFLMDVFYVWLQERFFFNQTFPGYELYKRQTPMLIPNRKSIVRCLQTITEGWKR